MKNYKTLGLSTIILFILALIWTLGHNPLGPIFLTLCVIFITYDILKNRINRTFYNVIMAAILAVMIFGEYFWVHIHNIIFYVFILTFSIGLLVSFYFYLTPRDQLTKRTIILSITGYILFLISLPGLIAIVFNNLFIIINRLNDSKIYMDIQIIPGLL